MGNSSKCHKQLKIHASVNSGINDPQLKERTTIRNAMI